MVPTVGRHAPPLVPPHGRRSGLEQHKLKHIWDKLVEMDIKNVELIAEKHNIKDTPWSLPDIPSMKLAEVRHGKILCSEPPNCTFQL